MICAFEKAADAANDMIGALEEAADAAKEPSHSYP